MSIEVAQREFDIMGFLTSAGKEEFWKEVDAAIKKFDTDKISLRPCKLAQLQRSDRKESKKLPTPLPNRRIDNRKWSHSGNQLHHHFKC